ncbi:MAG: hypothetical protein AB7O62_09135 [Pirellulales bacterium]
MQPEEQKPPRQRPEMRQRQPAPVPWLERFVVIAVAAACVGAFILCVWDFVHNFNIGPGG